jgi:S-adenosylmethionine:tRNA ribosyltransferase-isomerase
MSVFISGETVSNTREVGKGRIGDPSSSQKTPFSSIFATMQTSLFDYHLPQDRIAQEPVRPRDHSRLLVLDRKTGGIEHRQFFEIGEYLKAGDLLVVNDSKVFKARLKGWLSAVGFRLSATQNALAESRQPKADSPSIETFLLRPLDDCDWSALLKPSKKVPVGSTINFDDGVTCEVKEKSDDGTVRVTFNRTPDEIVAWTDRAGEIPVPPYVDRAPASLDDYQTVYAEKTGSVAAPTAGFHFTPELIASLKSLGVRFASVTLHVGLGTFRPMQTETLEEHQMHSEWINVPEETLRMIRETKANSGRVIAVGTTTVRALESAAQHLSLSAPQPLCPFSGMTKIFITPGFRFNIIDGLITNFHLPKSTLLVLVSAFAGAVHDDPDEGRKMILRAYEEAITEGYRFYSFGDAMFIRD